VAREEITRNHTQTDAREALNRMTTELYAGTGGGGHTIQDEGVDLPARARLDFRGPGATASDDAAGVTHVDIPGGISRADADARYVNEADHTKALHDSLLIDADTVDGSHASAFSLATHLHDDRYKRLSDERVAERAAADAASTYPLGLSIMEVATSAGWPAATGTVETLRYSDGRTVQFFTQKNGTLVRMRWWNEVSAAWSSFAIPNVADFAAASHVGSRDGHPLATTTAAGFMAAADKAKLDAQNTGFIALGELNHDIVPGTQTLLRLGVPEFITTGTFDDANDSWVVSRPGEITIGGMVSASGTTDGAQLQLSLYKNGLSLRRLAGVHSGSTRGLVCMGTTVATAVAGDYFQLYAVYFAPSGAANLTTIAANTYFYASQ
jgi:hypothetical protein